jgi:hypothetical protein
VISSTTLTPRDLVVEDIPERERIRCGGRTAARNSAAKVAADGMRRF